MIKEITKNSYPTKGTKYSAGIDLCSSVDIVLEANKTTKIPLGISFCFGGYDDKFKLSHYVELQPRSSFGAKGISCNTGIIDLDYEDEISLIAHNNTNTDIKVSKGQKIAQCVLKEHKTKLFEIHAVKVRDGGFGSTGE